MGITSSSTTNGSPVHHQSTQRHKSINNHQINSVVTHSVTLTDKNSTHEVDNQMPDSNELERRFTKGLSLLIVF